MPSHFDLAEVLRANPQVSAEMLEEQMDELRELRKMSSGRAGYKLVPPFTGRKVTIGRDTDRDPRTVQLRRSSDRA
jgi:hypothetical protein